MPALPTYAIDYDSGATRRRLNERSLEPMISEKGKPTPLQVARRWVVERTNSWHNAHKKLVWCTERRGRVIDFWIAFSSVVTTAGRADLLDGHDLWRKL